MPVPGLLAREIQQSKPYASVEEEAFLNLARTSEYLDHRLTEFLRPHQLSPTQYNVLRILRGAGSSGLSCSQVAERMVNHDPDITRLMDRLAKRGLAARSRGKQDRRVVQVRIAPAGMELLAKLDEPLDAFLKMLLESAGPTRLRSLIETLEDLRSRLAFRSSRANGSDSDRS